MKDEILVLLLQIIKNNENIQRLMEYGLEYYQMAEYINLALNQDYVIIQADKLVVTEKGIDKIKLLNQSTKNQWIRPLYEKRVNRLDKYDIYIPLK
ncbi:MAG: hypothetical protein ACLSV2_11935 [Clostridium sp.]